MEIKRLEYINQLTIPQVVMIVFYLMRLRLITSISIMLLGYFGFSQKVSTELYEVNGIEVVIESEELTEIVDNCGSIMNKLRLKSGEDEIYKISLCTTSFNEVLIREKGYLTVVEHYSEPVGWSQFYVFDICQMRLILTKKILESQGLEWNKFINPTKELKEEFISEIIPLH